jgi:hypothetical protein
MMAFMCEDFQAPFSPFQALAFCSRKSPVVGCEISVFRDTLQYDHTSFSPFHDGVFVGARSGVVR